MVAGINVIIVPTPALTILLFAQAICKTSKHFLEIQAKGTIEMQPSLGWNTAPAWTGYRVVLHGDTFVEDVYMSTYVYAHTCTNSCCY